MWIAWRAWSAAYRTVAFLMLLFHLAKELFDLSSVDLGVLSKWSAHDDVISSGTSGDNARFDDVVVVADEDVES